MKPDTQPTPAQKPRTITINIAKTKFETNAKIESIKPDAASDAPKIRLRENGANNLGPPAIPAAKPRKTDPKRIP